MFSKENIFILYKSKEDSIKIKLKKIVKCINKIYYNN